MNPATIQRMPDLLRRLVNDFLEMDKRNQALTEKSKEHVEWRDVIEWPLAKDPTAHPFWATVKSGAISRVELVAYFDSIGFCTISNIYAETYEDELKEEQITHWIKLNQPRYPAKKTKRYDHSQRVTKRD